MFENKAFYIELVEKRGAESADPMDLREAAIGTAKIIFATGAALIVVNGIMQILVKKTASK